MDLNSSDLSQFSDLPRRLSYSALDMSSVGRASSFYLSDLSSISSISRPSSIHPADFQKDRVDVKSKSSFIEKSTILDEGNGITVIEDIFGEFLERWQSLSASCQAFELAESFSRVCIETSNAIENLLLESTPGPNKNDDAVELMKWMRHEGHLWRLIKSLHYDRLDDDDDTERMAVDSGDQYQSAKDITQKLFQYDNVVRQAQLVIDWLENSAGDELTRRADRLEFFTDHAGPWPTTQRLLEQQLVRGTSSSSKFISRLDPDAPLREGGQLADLDQKDEDRMNGMIFDCIRAGQLDQAQEVCDRLGQPWKAATFEGWRLFHDPNYEREGEEELIDIEGNQQRDMWKLITWQMTNDPNVSAKLRAAYASHCGDLAQILPATASWSDRLWAYLRTFVDQKVEQELRLNLNVTRSWIALPKKYEECSLTMDKIFKEVDAATDLEAMNCLQKHIILVQKCIIQNNESTLIDEAGTIEPSDMGVCYPQYLRFMAHVVLFLRTIKILLPLDASEKILKLYVESVMRLKDIKLVAAYTGTLPANQQISLFAKYCVGMESIKEKHRCVIQAKAMNLPVETITTQVVEEIRQGQLFVAEDAADIKLENLMQGSASTEDLALIDALDWLLILPQQKAQALRQANAIARKFLGAFKLVGTKATINKLSTSIIKDIYQSYFEQTGSTELPKDDENAVREYFCYRAYLDAHEAFSDWFRHFHYNKPQPPKAIVVAEFVQRVAYEHLELRHKVDMDRWQYTLNLQTKATTEKIYNVLLFPDGGWLVDQHEPIVVETARAQQMKFLRRICIPVMVTILHSVLHSTEQYAESVALADLLASEQYQLYKLFTKEELTEVVQKIITSSTLLLGKNIDDLGYPTR